LRDVPLVARRRIDLDRDESVTQLAAQRLEARAGNGGVAGEAEPQEAVTVRGPFLDPREVGRVDADVGLVLLAERKWEGRLAEHRGEHAVVDHHWQRAPA